MTSFKKSLNEIVTKVVESTHKSMSTLDIFASKQDQMKHQTDVDGINQKLDTLLNTLLNPASGGDPTGVFGFSFLPYSLTSATLKRSATLSSHQTEKNMYALLWLGLLTIPQHCLMTSNTKLKYPRKIWQDKWSMMLNYGKISSTSLAAAWNFPSCCFMHFTFAFLVPTASPWS